MAMLRLFSGAILACAAAVNAQAKQHITQQTWDTMVRYTAFQAGSVPVPCATPPFGSSVVKYIVNNQTDTQATIFRDDRTKELILSIPGTASYVDDFFDILVVLAPLHAPGVDPIKTCPGCFVHTGFLAAWNSISADVLSTLNSSLAAHPSYTVTITGHSLGAGIAAIGYTSLKGSHLPINKAYTFGQPRTGNAPFANHIDKLSGASTANPGEFWRITHADDFIPRIIPTFPLGYRHSQTEFWQTNNTGGPQGHTGPDLTYRCFGQEPGDCNNSFGLASTPESHVIYTNQDLSSNYSCIGNI